MPSRSKQRKRSTSDKDGQPFDPNADHIKHTKIGVWDFYEDTTYKLKMFSSSVYFQKLDLALSSLPLVLRVFKTMTVLCYNSLVMYLVASLVGSLLPAVSLYYSAQLLRVAQESIDSRRVDKAVLFSVLGCRLATSAADRLTHIGKRSASENISRKLRRHFAKHIFQAYVRLDVPTFQDPVAQGQLSVSDVPVNAAWSGIRAIVATVSMIIQLISQVSVLMSVLRGQRDGFILALLSFADPVFKWITRPESRYEGVWAATCRNDDYIRMQGIKHLVNFHVHRQELVAGNLQEYATSEFHNVIHRVGDDDDLSIREMLGQRSSAQDGICSLSDFLRRPLKELPQVIFTFRAVQYPKSIPVSLASLNLIHQTVSSFSSQLVQLFETTSSLLESFITMRKLFEMVNIENQVVDGTEPYPEDTGTLKIGIAVEFRDVSFRYPNSDKYAIKNVSFSIGPGQLCVLVGFNGSGKSTILKLLARLYDPTEGKILIDGRDIKTFRLADLRRCISVLFQDYTHFPLSIKENIGMGNPEHAHDDDMIRQAAELGGATELIENLPEGFDSYIWRPVQDYYAGLPEGTETLFGRKVTYGRIRGMMGTTQDKALSGGQMQRLAVSRTFMRSLGDNSPVGLLLFDEPSASLDPTAEHDLFERLRKLRGNKTMVFSSHRFGQLTRHADVILYMSNSTVSECGTHDKLLKMNGGYAKMYNIQASNFK